MRRSFFLTIIAPAFVCASCSLTINPTVHRGTPSSEGSQVPTQTNSQAISTAKPADPEQADSHKAPDPNAKRITKCPGEPNAPEITDNIDKVPPPNSPLYKGWVYEGDSNYDRCSALSYATLMPQEYPFDEFVMQLMLFHEGEYIGVGALVPAQHVVIGSDHRSVTVRYKDWEAYYHNGDHTRRSDEFTTDVTYVWAGDHVEAIGRIPNQEL